MLQKFLRQSLISAWTVSAIYVSSGLALMPRAFAEDEINENPLHAEISINPSALPPGGQGEVFVDLNIDPPYKAYVDSIKLTAKNPPGLLLGNFQIDPVIEFKDTFSGKMKKGVKGHATLKALLELAPEVAEGDLPTEFSLTYQACTEKHCLFPKTIALSKTLNISAQANPNSQPTSGPTASPNAMSDNSGFGAALEKGTLYAFLFVFLAGLLTSLTPCIFPMIPITLAILGTRTAGQSKLRSLLLSLSYVFGIALTYATLGVIAAKTGALFGAALSSPWVVSAIALIFTAMGLSMYGAFELQVPQFIQQKLGARKTGSGFLGAFVTGLIAGIVASPCVGPVLVGVLTFVAQTQNVVMGFSLLFTFALGLGVLFIVLGTSGSFMNRIPRSGDWMDGVKFIFGTAMIGMALYYIAPLAPQRLFDGLMAIALICISSYFGAFRQGESLTQPKLQLAKGLLLTMFIVGLAYTLLAVFGRGSLTTVSPVDGTSATFKKLDWQPYSDEVLRQAAQQGKPVVIDFYADWCAACKELELLTFSQDSVQAEAAKYLFLKIDATEESPSLAELKKKYRVMGLPTLIFINPKGEVRWDLTLTGFEDAEAFVKRLTALSQP